MPAAAKVTFYELNEQRAILTTFLAETEGEETPAIAELWEQLEGDAETKACNWAKFNKELALEAKQIEAMEAPLKAELTRLAGERKALEARVERNRTELSRQMRLFGLEKVKQPGVSIWHVDEKPEIVTPSIDALPPEQLAFAEELGVVSFTPEHSVTIPAQWAWDTVELVRYAEQLEQNEQRDADVRAPMDPLPAGVQVTFRKGIRIR